MCKMSIDNIIEPRKIASFCTFLKVELSYSELMWLWLNRMARKQCWVECCFGFLFLLRCFESGVSIGKCLCSVCVCLWKMKVSWKRGRVAWWYWLLLVQTTTTRRTTTIYLTYPPPTINPAWWPFSNTFNLMNRVVGLVRQYELASVLEGGHYRPKGICLRHLVLPVRFTSFRITWNVCTFCLCVRVVVIVVRVVSVQCVFCSCCYYHYFPSWCLRQAGEDMAMLLSSWPYHESIIY